MHSAVDSAEGREGAMGRRRARFSLGRTVATRGALQALLEVRQSPLVFLARHAAGDWGDLWIITEADRSATTILLPEEY